MEKVEYLKLIIAEIKNKNAIHGKRLEKTLSGLDDEFYRDAENFFQKYETLLNTTGHSLVFAIDSYLKMINDMMKEYIYFFKYKEYRCKSFEDAYNNVYNNPEIMSYYMHGLLMSQFLWKHHHQMVTFFSKNLKHLEIRSYLEIGGGHGLYLLKANEHFGDKVNFEMVDISDSSLEIAKSIVKNNKIRYTHKDIFDIDTEKKKYDFIVMGEVLEHVEQPDVLLTQLKKLLNPGGTAFITTPTNAPAIDHIYLFRNENEIIHLINKCGFKVDKKLSVFSEDVTFEEGEKRNIAMLFGAFISPST